MFRLFILAVLLLAGMVSAVVAQPCTGLCLQQVICPGGGTTSVKGTVYAPNGMDPLPNVIVYVPNAPVQPFAAGVQASVPVSGSPLVRTTSAVDGSFTLSNMPAGTNIPLVIQSGKWRRQIKIANVPACANTPLPAAQTRFPTKQSEGDIPKIVVVTGSNDAAECTLRKIGISDGEFSDPTTIGGQGRVNFYLGRGSAGASYSVRTPAETALFASPAILNSYDMAMLNCQGDAYPHTTAELQVLANYANAGGRVFATHYAFAWLTNNPGFPNTVKWNVGQTSPLNDPQTAYIDQSFPKGAQLAQWLMNVGASTTLGQIPISALRMDQDGVIAPTQSWLTINDPAYGNASRTMQFTFNTPVGVPPANQVGRVQFNEYHVSDANTAGTVFPGECPLAAMTPQEKLLEFSLFDLAAQVVPDQPSTIELGFTNVPTKFTQGDAADTVAVYVGNPSTTIVLDATLTLTAAIPNGLSLTAIAGQYATTGWSCSVATASCTRTAPLAAGSVDPIELKLAVSATAPVGNPVTLTVTAEHGGLAAASVKSDLIPIRALPQLVWTAPAPITYGTPLGAAQLNAVATAGGAPVAGTFTYTPAAGAVLDAGNQTLSATFVPDDAATYGTPASPATTTITVNPASQTITFTSTPPANPTVGTTYQVTATGGASGNPVTFAIDPISSPNACTISGNVVAFTGTGACAVAAAQSGDGNHAPGYAQQFMVVSAASSATALAATPAVHSSYGQGVTFIATITTANPSAGGTVAFIDDTANPRAPLAGCGAVPLIRTSAAGSPPIYAASCPNSTLSVGPHAITATYSGDDDTGASDNTLAHTIDAIGIDMTLRAAPNPARFGQTVTLTAAVSASPATNFVSAFSMTGAPHRTAMSPLAAPTGTVTFYDGTTLLGIGALDAGGVATLSLSSLAPGTRNLSATYSGGAVYAEANAQAVLVVSAAEAAVPAPLLSVPVLLLLCFVFAGPAMRSARRRRAARLP